MIIKKIKANASIFVTLLLCYSPLSHSTEVVDFHTIMVYLPSAFVALVLPYLLFTIHKLRRSRQQLSISERRLKSTVEGSGDTLWDWNIKTGEVLRINDKYRMDKNTIIDVPPNKALIHPNDIAQVELLLKQHFAEQTAFFEASYRIKDSFDRWHWVLDRGKIIEKDANLNPLRMTGTVRDITQLKSTEARLNLFAKCVESLTDALAIYDKNFNLVDLNPSFLTQFGGNRDNYLNKPFTLPGYEQSYIDDIKDTVRATEHWQQEVKLRNSERKLLPIEISIDEIKNEHNQICNYVIVFSDLTERKKAESQLHNLSNRDRTTGLPNRNLFFTDLKKLAKKDNHHALLVFDLDNFKKINDSLGHQLGDSLLAKLAMRLNKLTREKDVFYRLGGMSLHLLCLALTISIPSPVWQNSF
ncbi:hypothetical protein KAN5_17320 [Pseudoalteromonas sp. KAN5]|nr:hypothetical protein KAN5_17320 [Pseudoalteromonas sp. KAN5]